MLIDLESANKDDLAEKGREKMSAGGKGLSIVDKPSAPKHDTRREVAKRAGAMVAANIANLEDGRPEENPSIGGFKQPDAARLLNVGRASARRPLRRTRLPQVQRNALGLARHTPTVNVA
jgi:hypothetical protein